MIQNSTTRHKTVEVMFGRNRKGIRPHWQNFFWKQIYDTSYLSYVTKGITRSNFSFYQNNGGTILAIGGKNFSLVASDTRFSIGMTIPSRSTTRIIKISPNVILASAGMFADLFILQNLMQKGIELFRKENSSICLISNCAFYLSYMLYTKRFFPYYTFNILCGLEINREGSVFNFDSIGSFEKNFISCVGNAQSQIQPILDGIFQKKSLNFSKDSVSLLAMKSCIKNIFLKISNRNISVGDGLQIFIITKKGIFIENNFLKLD